MFRFLFVAVSLFCATSLFAQTDTGEPLYTTMLKVNNNIYMLQGKGGNIGLSFGTDGVFMVDSEFAENIEQMQGEIKKISDKPVEFLVNTHFHKDHTGGNPAMAETGTIIVSQENTRERLMEVIDEEKKKIKKDLLPMITFSKDITFYFNGEKIYVIHVPNAHTDGDAIVYFTLNNVLQTGDLFFNGKYPFIDLKNGGSVAGYIEGMGKALALIDKNTKIIPGHGPLASYKDLEGALEMLSIAYKKVSQQATLGKTEDEVAAMTDITEDYDKQGYGDGFIDRETFLRTIYKEVGTDSQGKEERIKKNEEARKKYEKIKKQRATKKG